MASDTEDIGANKIRRRTRSVTRAEEISTKQQKQRRSQPDKPYDIISFQFTFSRLNFTFYYFQFFRHNQVSHIYHNMNFVIY